MVEANDNAMITIRGWGGWVVRANDNVIIFPPKAGFFFIPTLSFFPPKAEIFLITLSFFPPKAEIFSPR